MYHLLRELLTHDADVNLKIMYILLFYRKEKEEKERKENEERKETET